VPFGTKYIYSSPEKESGNADHQCPEKELLISCQVLVRKVLKATIRCGLRMRLML
jgi:hypothetical protein